jgi:hypothetical protein
MTSVFSDLSVASMDCQPKSTSMAELREADDGALISWNRSSTEVGQVIVGIVPDNILLGQ